LKQMYVYDGKGGKNKKGRERGKLGFVSLGI